jgi:hypothetical protein
MDYAILKGISSYLIGEFDEWNARNCKGMPDEQPDPVMGDIFAAVHVVNSQGTSRDSGLLDDVFDFAVTVTKRIEAIPYDKITDQVYIKQLMGIEPIVTRITYAIWNRWEPINAINAQIVADPQLEKYVGSRRFIAPCKKSNRTGKLRFHDEDFLHGNKTRNRDQGFVAVSLSVYFGNLILQTVQTEGTC